MEVERGGLAQAVVQDVSLLRLETCPSGWHMLLGHDIVTFSDGAKDHLLSKIVFRSPSRHSTSPTGLSTAKKRSTPLISTLDCTPGCYGLYSPSHSFFSSLAFRSALSKVALTCPFFSLRDVANSKAAYFSIDVWAWHDLSHKVIRIPRHGTYGSVHVNMEGTMFNVTWVSSSDDPGIYRGRRPSQKTSPTLQTSSSCSLNMNLRHLP